MKVRLVKGMKLSDKQIQRLVRKVFESLKSKGLVQFKSKEEVAYQRAVELVKNEYQKEVELEAEVNRMMDELERQNPGQFERYKMFPLLKRKLAKEKGIVL